ncbi:MAG: hypothetical protein M1823_004759 [Watsoniomyces obsoletus]|nr:MAG: hypothetical protein M1823_004759 [Watsoniomyces obsoletus]
MLVPTLSPFLPLIVAVAVQHVQAHPIEMAGEGSVEPWTVSKELFRRVPLGMNTGLNIFNARDAEMDCTNLEDICDADAYAMLCRGKPSIMQRTHDKAQAAANRQTSGATHQDFKRPADKQKGAGVAVPSPRADGERFESAEEFPFASTYQGGEGALLFPALRVQQSSKLPPHRSASSTGHGLIEHCRPQDKAVRYPPCIDDMVLRQGDGSGS